MPASIKDVAKEAGLSAAAVSRHLNGSLDLPAKTKARIDKAVKLLGYRPNPHARRLTLGRSETLTLIVPDITNPFFASLASAIERAASRREKFVQLHVTANLAEREIAVLELAAENRSDGVVFCTNRRPGDDVSAAIRELERVVVVDDLVPNVDAPHVFADNEQGGYLAGKHFGAYGHAKVAYIGGDPQLMSTRLRTNGLRRGLAEGRDGLNPNVTVFSGDYDIPSGRALTKDLLSGNGGETAVFVGSDELAIGVIEVLREHNVRVPNEMSLISFDGASALHLYDPPITAIRQPAEDIGERAVALLLNEKTETNNAGRSFEYLPVELIERASVGPPIPRTRTRKIEPSMKQRRP